MIEDGFITRQYFQIAWRIAGSGIVVDAKIRKAKYSMGLVFNSLINTTKDLYRLKNRFFTMILDMSSCQSVTGRYICRYSISQIGNVLEAKSSPDEQS